LKISGYIGVISNYVVIQSIFMMELKKKNMMQSVAEDLGHGRKTKEGDTRSDKGRARIHAKF